VRKTSHALLWLLLRAATSGAADFTPPPTTIHSVTETLHGITITDPYRWLESQDSPETRAWLAEQDKFARRYLDAIPGRAQIRQAFEGLMKIASMESPILRNGRYFFGRRNATEDRTSLWMRRGYEGKDELLVDPRTLSPEPTTSVSYRDVTPDGAMVAFGIRRGGEDEIEIRLMDVATHKLLPDVLPRGRYSSMRIKPDKSGLY
jgi:prolyl oligopeptidase